MPIAARPFDCPSVGTEHGVSFLLSFRPTGVVAPQLEANVHVRVPSEIDVSKADRKWINRKGPIRASRFKAGRPFITIMLNLVCAVCETWRACPRGCR